MKHYYIYSRENYDEYAWHVDLLPYRGKFILYDNAHSVNDKIFFRASNVEVLLAKKNNMPILTYHNGHWIKTEILPDDNIS
jgi:hypothetical protein